MREKPRIYLVFLFFSLMKKISDTLSQEGKYAYYLMSEKKGYSITTRRLRIRCRHPEWLQQTQDFYNEIEEFYYRLFLTHPEFHQLGSQKALREMEVLSLPGRQKNIPESPLPWEKVPLYFRRSAANAGISAAKSHLARSASEHIHQNNVRQAEKLRSAVVYYKGMYRDFSDEGITLKVWNGSEWKWMKCRLYGRGFPEEARIMSPSVVFEYKYIMLHVPIKEEAGDITSVKKRMEEGTNLCSLQFTNGDAFAVGCITDKDGKELAVRFFKGGAEYRHRCSQILEKIEKSNQSMGDHTDVRQNRKYWMHLKQIDDFYAHNISREIVDLCEEYEASVIALPKYDEVYSGYVMKGSGYFSPLHLSLRIRRNLSYKAWKSGIIVIEVSARGISTTCAHCSSQVIAADKKNSEYLCSEGHRGSRHLNAARNLSRKCRLQFTKTSGMSTA